MRKHLLGLALVLPVLLAAAPGPDPVITLDGVSAAARLSPQKRAAIAPQVKALNARLEKMVEVRLAAKAGTAKAADPHCDLHEVMKGIHELMEQLNEQERQALHEYIHAQLKAAGIEIPHDVADHARHAETHGQAHGHRVCAG
jgi:hypothetical protein